MASHGDIKNISSSADIFVFVIVFLLFFRFFFDFLNSSAGELFAFAQNSKFGFLFGRSRSRVSHRGERVIVILLNIVGDHDVLAFFLDFHLHVFQLVVLLNLHLHGEQLVIVKFLLLLLRRSRLGSFFYLHGEINWVIKNFWGLRLRLRSCTHLVLCRIFPAKIGALFNNLLGLGLGGSGATVCILCQWIVVNNHLRRLLLRSCIRCPWPHGKIQFLDVSTFCLISHKKWSNLAHGLKSLEHLDFLSRSRFCHYFRAIINRLLRNFEIQGTFLDEASTEQLIFNFLKEFVCGI